tara:strand:+ start:2910 stop:3131 length:222 start_codon:yes stop_codon:yes gene_type:complete
MDNIIEVIPVEGHTTLGRDPTSNAILNSDDTQYEAYKKARLESKKKERELSTLRNEVEELKDLVHTLVQKADK